MESKLKFKTKIENLSLVEKLVEDINENNIVNEDLFGYVMVCVTEAVNNAIHHGNKLDENKDIEVIVNYTEAKICFDVIDQGKGFDFKAIPDPTLPENLEKPHGRGVFLISKLADELEFLNGGSHIQFAFNLK